MHLNRPWKGLYIPPIIWAAEKNFDPGTVCLVLCSNLYSEDDYIRDYQEFLERGDLRIQLLGRGFAWLDTGTHESLLEAAHFVETIETRQGYKIAWLEEIAFNNGWIEIKQLNIIAKSLSKSSYGKYLMSLLNRVKGNKNLDDKQNLSN